MTNLNCVTCGKSKNLLVCECCSTQVCKNCAHILSEEAFSFVSIKSDIMTKKIFCNPCYLSEVGPQLDLYENRLELAKDVNIYFSYQGKETRLMSRKEKSIQVLNCADREETLLRLAFMAVEKGFDTILDVQLVGEKQRMGSYQKTIYKAQGTPTILDQKLIIRDRSFSQSPN